VDRLGLIMLILIGTVPTAFALNHAVTTDQTQEFIAASKEAAAVFERHAAGLTASADPRTELTAYLRNSHGGTAHAACHRSADSRSGRGAVVLWVMAEIAGSADPKLS
jgi:inorganic phosphate transporter, PiT family